MRSLLHILALCLVIAQAMAANAAPVVTSPAHVFFDPVTDPWAAITATFSDDGGAQNLTYTWSVTAAPVGGSVSFDPNNASDANGTLAIFSRAGTYTCRVTAVDAGGLSASSSVTINVGQRLTTLVVSPPASWVAVNASQPFTVSALDQFGMPMASTPTITWTVDGGGTISPAGVFTAGAATGGPFIVAATANGRRATALVTVTAVPNAAPVVVTPAAAAPASVSATTTQLTVGCSDDGGEPGLIYTWSATNSPSGATVTFSGNNGTNSGKAVTATFDRAGTYSFMVTASDAGFRSVTSSVTVSVMQTRTAITISPTSAAVAILGSTTFVATERDQFGQSMVASSALTFAVSGGGSITSGGVFTAGGTPGGPFTVTASAGTTTGTASVVVTAVPNAGPTVATPAAATPFPLTGTTGATLSVLGADDAGESALTYTWAATTVPTFGEATFNRNGTNAAKSVTATFTRIGTYVFTVTISDAGLLTATSTVSIVVDQALALVTIEPSTASVATNATKTFRSVGWDQFGHTTFSNPICTWTVTGGGTIAGNLAQGVFSAGSTAGGPFTVSATADGKTGTATVIVSGSSNDAPSITTQAANAGPIILP